MKTAEDLYNEFFDKNSFNKENILKLLNEARKETIEECAKRATIIGEWVATDFGNEVQVCGHLDKQSILSLINELK